MRKTIRIVIYLIGFQSLQSLQSLYAQKYGEIGGYIGSSFFIGDVHAEVSQNAHLSYGISYRYNFNSRWAIKAMFRTGQISGDDANSSIPFEYQRNLSFTSKIYDLGGVIEFNFLDFSPYAPLSLYRNSNRFTPYIFTGISVISTDPMAELAGSMYTLQPLSTEGVTYANVALALPIGVGIKWRVSDRFLLEIMGELRATTSDYLDDVSGQYPEDPNTLSKTARDLSNRTTKNQGNNSSWGAQRGSNSGNDWIAYFGGTIHFNLNKNPGSCHFNSGK